MTREVAKGRAGRSTIHALGVVLRRDPSRGHLSESGTLIRSGDGHQSGGMWRAKRKVIALLCVRACMFMCVCVCVRVCVCVCSRACVRAWPWRNAGDLVTP